MSKRTGKVKSEDFSPEQMKRRKLYSKLASYLMIGAIYAVISGSSMANHIKHNLGSYTQDESVAINVMRIAFIVALIGAFLMSKFQGNIYGAVLSRKRQEKLDERQANIRRKVLEKSYRGLTILLIFGLFLIFNSQSVLSIDARDGDVLIPLATVILCVLALPNLVATWEKDS